MGADFFALPEDDIQLRIHIAYRQIKLLALKLDWARFYDLIEFIANDPAPNALTDKERLLKRGMKFSEEFSDTDSSAHNSAPITSDEEMLPSRCPPQSGP